MASSISSVPASLLTATRLSIGLAQGGVVWLLEWSLRWALWTKTYEELFTSLLATAFFVPIIAVAGIGNLRPRILALWLACVSILCAGLGWHSIFRQPPLDHRADFTWIDFYVPMIGLFFVAHALVAAADSDRRMIASARTYFDITWKQAAQLTLACIFISALWSLLHLCATFLQSANIGTLARIIETDYVWIPVTAVIGSLAFDLVDRHAVRMLTFLKLLLPWTSWLLLIALPCAMAYPIVIAVNEQAPPWNARYGVADLLALAGTLIFLVNARNPDDDYRANRSQVLPWARFAAVLLVLCLVVLAAIRLGTAIMQRGWYPLIVILFAWWLVMACYAVGYMAVAIRSGIRLRELTAANAISAMLLVGLTIALLSPVADPARLSVANQIDRLDSGRVAPDEFDYLMLAHQGVRYGRQALETLRDRKEGADAAAISSKAAAALKSE